MKITVGSSIPKDQGLIVFAFEGADSPLIKQAATEGFKAKESSTAVLHPQDGPAPQVILVGLGDKKKFSKPDKVPEAIETLRRAAAAGVRKAQSLSQKSISILLPQALKEPKE